MVSSSLRETISSTASAFALSTNPIPTTTAPDTDAILATRTPSCVISYGPSSSLELPAMDNDQYIAHLQRICPLLATWRTEVKEVFVDETKLSAIVRADHYMTPKGRTEPAKNDFMWLLTFNETGERVEKATEFMDSVASQKLMGELKAVAMKLQNGAAQEA